MIAITLMIRANDSSPIGHHESVTLGGNQLLVWILTLGSPELKESVPLPHRAMTGCRRTGISIGSVLRQKTPQR